MSEIVSQKPLSKSQVKEFASKESLSQDEALLVLSYYDSLLSEAGKRRKKPVSDDSIQDALLESGSFRLAGFGGIAFLGSTFVGTMIEPAMMAGSVLSIIPFMIGALVTAAPNLKKKIASRKAKSKAEELIAKKRLHEMEEEAYAKVAKKVLKKVRPALEIVNNSLPTEEFIYHDTLGEEGFELKPKNFTKWEKAKIGILQSESSESVLELDAPKISLRKAIEA